MEQPELEIQWELGKLNVSYPWLEVEDLLLSNLKFLNANVCSTFFYSIAIKGGKLSGFCHCM